MGRKASTQLKEQLKNLAKFNANHRKSYEELSIDDKIEDYKSRISRYEKDLIANKLSAGVAMLKIQTFKDMITQLEDEKLKICNHSEVTNVEQKDLNTLNVNK